MPGISTTIRSAPWVWTTGLGHARLVDAGLDDVADDAERARIRLHPVDLLRQVLDAQAALQVEPELRLELAPAACVRSPPGMAALGKKSTKRASRPMRMMRIGPARRTKRDVTRNPPGPPEPGSTPRGGLDPLRQRAADPGHGGDLLHRRLADALHRAEHLEQLALALRPDAGQVVERRPHRALRAQVAVVRDREPVRLVAEPLDQVQRLRRRRQQDRIGAAGQEQLLALLGEAGQRQVVQPELVEDLLGGADLALARRRR